MSNVVGRWAMIANNPAMRRWGLAGLWGVVVAWQPFGNRCSVQIPGVGTFNLAKHNVLVVDR